jgi:hypothetical protein
METLPSGLRRVKIYVGIDPVSKKRSRAKPSGRSSSWRLSTAG